MGMHVTGGSSSNHILNGEFSGNTGDGIVVDTSNVMPFDNRFENLEITNNAGNGIAILGGSGHLIIDSNITSNNTSRAGYGGVAVVDAGATLRTNTIADNDCHGVYADDGLALQPVDAADNYWGDPSGPSGEGPGGGDMVSEHVLFTLVGRCAGY